MAFSLSAIRQSKTVHTIAVFATGNMVAMLLGVAGSLVQARYVAPEEMGIFRTFTIVAGYLTFLHLGVFDGLQREIPLQMGRGNWAKAEQAASACLAWITFISLAGGVLFLALALRAAYYGEWMRFWGWLAYLPFIVATFYGGYLGTTFRTGQQFITLSKTSVIQAIAGTLVLPLLPILGYYGACLRTAVGSITNLFLLHHWRPMKVRPHFDWCSFREVIRIGLPLSGIGYLATSLWVSMEGSLVLGWFGIKALGLYSVAVVVRTVIGQLVQNISQVLSVRICERYGRSNSAKDALHRIVTPIVLISIASLPLIAVGWLLMPWVVRLLIPRYVESIPLMQIFLFMTPLALLHIPMAVLWIAVKLFDCGVSVIIGLVTFVAAAYYFYWMDYGLSGTAIAYIVGQTAYLVAGGVFTIKLLSKERNTLQLQEAMLIYGSET
jgi:O-antigen/teichoic acid export membrane protein